MNVTFLMVRWKRTSAMLPGRIGNCSDSMSFHYDRFECDAKSGMLDGNQLRAS
jgi:hypothetical protein